jgi:hypothetical protein
MDNMSARLIDHYLTLARFVGGTQGCVSCLSSQLIAPAQGGYLFVKAEAFRLLRGEDALVDYQFGGNAVHHLFCTRCSVNSRNAR